MFKASCLRRLARDERGAAAVMVAAALVMLMGCLAMAFDIGQLALWQVRTANAADAAALAGAQELPGDPQAAFEAALAYGRANGISPEQMTISVGESVAVDIERPVDFAFAPVLGLYRGTARAHARALLRPSRG